jgi:hypothetical protein
MIIFAFKGKMGREYLWHISRRYTWYQYAYFSSGSYLHYLLPDNWLKSLKGEDHLDDLGLVGRIILK